MEDGEQTRLHLPKHVPLPSSFTAVLVPAVLTYQPFDGRHDLAHPYVEQNRALHHQVPKQRNATTRTTPEPIRVPPPAPESNTPSAPSKATRKSPGLLCIRRASCAAFADPCHPTQRGPGWSHAPSSRRKPLALTHAANSSPSPCPPWSQVRESISVPRDQVSATCLRPTPATSAPMRRDKAPPITPDETPSRPTQAERRVSNKTPPLCLLAQAGRQSVPPNNQLISAPKQATPSSNAGRSLSQASP